jgi:hypothetical protein
MIESNSVELSMIVERVKDQFTVDNPARGRSYIQADVLEAIDRLAVAVAPLVSASVDLLAALEGVIAVSDRQTVEYDFARAAIAQARKAKAA